MHLFRIILTDDGPAMSILTTGGRGCPSVKPRAGETAAVTSAVAVTSEVACWPPEVPAGPWITQTNSAGECNVMCNTAI